MTPRPSKSHTTTELAWVVMGNASYRSTFHREGQLALELKVERETSVSTYCSTTKRMIGSYTNVWSKGSRPRVKYGSDTNWNNP